MVGRPFCFTHDPTRAVDRQAARRRGGFRTRTPVAGVEGRSTLRSVEDILALLEETLADSRLLENSAQRSKTLVSIALAALKALEIGELEERLEALERQFGERLGVAA
jgi:hypothetical protein